MTLVSGSINYFYIGLFESVYQITVVKPELVIEIDEFAVFPMIHLRKFRK